MYLSPSFTTKPDLVLKSPAKINLFLHITGRRESGYHELETLFQFVDWGDILGFELTDDSALLRKDYHNYSLPEKDLTIRAAEMLLEIDTPKPKKGVTIHLKKQIPAGTGLGGGSSNAASTLIALNSLWEMNLSRDQLMIIAAKLGADVPVFVYGQSCLGRGVGDQLTVYSELDEGWVCLAIPSVHVSTQGIFEHPKLERRYPPLKDEDYSFENTTNVLQPVTTSLYPEVQEALDRLAKYGKPRMSGSGGTVFIECDSKNQAELIAKSLPAHIKGVPAKTINAHPHLEMVHHL